MKRLRWFLSAALWAVFLCPAFAHDIYRDWKMPDQRQNGQRYMSCCNEIDCAPRRTKFDGGTWFVEFNGQYIPVPPGKVETGYRDAWVTPDGIAHACINPQGVIYCFTPPGGAV